MEPNIQVLNNGIWIFQNLLTTKECDELLEFYKDKERLEATTIGIKQSAPGDKIEVNDYKNEDVRKGHIKFSRNLYDIPHGERLVMALDNYAADTGVKLFDDDVDFQLAIYDNVGDHFVWHEDHKQCLGTFDTRQRKLSCSLQLSDTDDYEGCDLQVRLPQDEKGIKPVWTASRNRGDMIVFPSFANHRVTELKSGIRQSLVLWYNGPAWR